MSLPSVTETFAAFLEMFLKVKKSAANVSLISPRKKSIHQLFELKKVISHDYTWNKEIGDERLLLFLKLPVFEQ